jgi:hypothetical protein
LPDLGESLLGGLGLSHEQVADASVALYRTYVGEWETFPYQLPSRNRTLCA